MILLIQNLMKMTIVNSMKKNQMMKKKKDLPPVEGDEEEVKK